MVGDTINSTLSQRQNTLLESLQFDLTNNINNLTSLLTETKNILYDYKTIFLTIVNKFFYKFQLFVLSSVRKVDNMISFTFINFNLLKLVDQTTLLDLYKNLLSSHQMLVESQQLLSDNTTISINDQH